MTDPFTLILRIYRREPGRVSGVAEDAQTGARRPFSTAEGLWELVVGPGASPQTGSAPEAPRPTNSEENEP
jgi:hypothetical protein